MSWEIIKVLFNHADLKNHATCIQHHMTFRDLSLLKIGKSGSKKQQWRT